MNMFSVFGILLLALATGPAGAAGFDCKRAAGPAEKLVCADKVLRQADGELADVYRDAVRWSAEPDRLVAAQRRWLREVRDRCTTAACLKAAYQERARVLNGTVASFDCDKAAAPVEKRICASDSLRYGDRRVGDAFRDWRDAALDPDAVVADQKRWLHDVRDRCAADDCLSTVLAARVDELVQRRDQRIAAVAEGIGYAKHAFHADLMRWPGDRNRSVAAFATQASARDDSGDMPEADEDFILDVYVLDTRTAKVFQHVREAVGSDAIAFSGMRLDRTNYAAALGAPAVGILLNHSHTGCMAYSSTSLRVYTVAGRQLKSIVDGLQTASGGGMCGDGCENHQTYRKLQFGQQAAGRYPDLAVAQTTFEDTPSNRPGECRTARGQSSATLRFDGSRYPLPKDMRY